MPRSPDITLPMAGEDGNAIAILGRAKHAAQVAGLSTEEIQALHDEATSGDYDHLLRTCMAWFNVE